MSARGPLKFSEWTLKYGEMLVLVSITPACSSVTTAAMSIMGAYVVGMKPVLLMKVFTSRVTTGA